MRRPRIAIFSQIKAFLKNKHNHIVDIGVSQARLLTSILFFQNNAELGKKGILGQPHRSSDPLYWPTAHCTPLTPACFQHDKNLLFQQVPERRKVGAYHSFHTSLYKRINVNPFKKIMSRKNLCSK